MDVICKDCECNIDEHSDSGCCHCDICDNSPSDIAKIYITEQQARLDTNRQQVAYLMKEQEYLWNVFVELRGAFHRIIGNVNNSEIVLEICDKVLRIIDNEK